MNAQHPAKTCHRGANMRTIGRSTPTIPSPIKSWTKPSIKIRRTGHARRKYLHMNSSRFSLTSSLWRRYWSVSISSRLDMPKRALPSSIENVESSLYCALFSLIDCWTKQTLTKCFNGVLRSIKANPTNELLLSRMRRWRKSKQNLNARKERKELMKE